MAARVVVQSQSGGNAADAKRYGALLVHLSMSIATMLIKFSLEKE
jgi:hypothetical protein